jgi:hypothetical protein
VFAAAETIAPDGNYFLYLQSNGLLHAEPCLPGHCEPCANKTITSDTRVYTCCTGNRLPSHTNPFCGTCDRENGYYSFNNKCVKCEKTNWGIIVGLLFLMWAYVTVYHILAQSSSADVHDPPCFVCHSLCSCSLCFSAQMNILLNFGQYVRIFLSFSTYSFVTWLSILNLYSPSLSCCRRLPHGSFAHSCVISLFVLQQCLPILWRRHLHRTVQ